MIETIILAVSQNIVIMLTICSKIALAIGFA
jgi:hypothetical protein